MIPQVQQEKAIKIGNMQTEQASIELTAEMFDMLSSKVYKNKPLAVIREILCNARDAQVSAGVNKPIYIHCPNQLEPYLAIRDYGTGLSEDEVMGLYLRYGWSDKRDSNDVIGGLGIGSKSPLAYSESFLVTSFYNGTVSTYSIYKDEGIPQVSKIGSKPTEEPNGVEVKVAIKPHDRNVFERELIGFLKFFDYPIKSNYQNLDELEKPKAIMEGEGYHIYGSGGYNTKLSALMGGVMYTLSDEYLSELAMKISNNHKHIVLDFEIGEVSVAASRETLSEDKPTIAAINKRIESVNEVYLKDLQRELNEIDYVYDALVFCKSNGLSSVNWQGKLQVATNFLSLTYKKVPLTEAFKVLDENVNVIKVEWGSSTGKVMALPLINLKNPVVLINDKRGHIKLASKISRQGTEVGSTVSNQKIPVIILDEGDKSSIDHLKTIYKGLEIIYTSKVYDEYFPKTDTITVKRSGLFTINMVEVTELDETQEGYYLLHHGSQYSPSDSNEFISSQLVKLIQTLKRQGDIKEDLFICRKGGLPAVAETKLKELTLKELTSILDKLITDEVLSQIVYKYKVNLGITDKVSAIIFESTAKKYLGGLIKCKPISFRSDINTIAAYYDVVLEYCESISERFKQKRDDLNKEIQFIEDNFNLLTYISSYDDIQEDEIEEYINMKLYKLEKTNKGEKK